MEIRRLVGRNLKEVRETRGLSQEDLALEADIHRTYVSGVERAVRNPTIVVLAKLAKALGVPPARLLEESKPGRAKKK